MKRVCILVLLTVAQRAAGDPPAKQAEPRWPAYVGVGAAIVGIVVGSVSAFEASDQAERARGLYETDPRYQTARNAFRRDRSLAVGGFALAAGGIGWATYWSLTRLAKTRLAVRAGNGQAMLVLELVR